MRAKLIVFPIRGRNWCFTRTIDHSLSANPVSSQSPSSFKDLWINVKVADKSPNAKVELCVDFIANKMNKAWIGLEKAPDRSLKKKIHGLGLWLLSRVKPSEIFLKSISKEITSVEVIYPSSLNAQLVRRRLRHIAMRGSIIHRKYFYGSVSLIPLTSALSGSEKLLQLVSTSSSTSKSSKTHTDNEDEDSIDKSHHNLQEQNWVLRPSKPLDDLLHVEDGVEDNGLSKHVILQICKIYDLNISDVIKYGQSF